MRISFLLAGTFLQLLGVGTAAIGIKNVRRDFNVGLGIVGATRGTLHSIFDPLINHLRTVLKRKPQPAQLHGHISASSTVSAHAHATVTIAEFPELDSERIQWLKARIDALMAQINSLEDYRGRTEMAMSNHISESEAEHRRLDEISRSRIRDFASGGLRLQSLGVALLMMGSVFLLVGSLAH